MELDGVMEGGGNILYDSMVTFQILGFWWALPNEKCVCGTAAFLDGQGAGKQAQYTTRIPGKSFPNL